MSEQTYSVIRKQIVKAKNMTHARMVSEGYDNFPGEVLHDDCEIIETEINKNTVKESKKEVIFEKEIEDNPSNNIKPKQKKRKKNEKK